MSDVGRPWMVGESGVAVGATQGEGSDIRRVVGYFDCNNFTAFRMTDLPYVVTFEFSIRINHKKVCLLACGHPQQMFHS